jgi:monoamine oxidase
VYTHRFNDQPNQYFEAGAMRLPEIPEQQPVFDLISFLNQRVPADMAIELIPYVLYDKTGNLVYVNGTRGADGAAMTYDYADENPTELGFDDATTGGKTASEMIDEVIGGFLKALEDDFAQGFAKILQFDDYSFRSYLAQVVGWSEAKINYVEVMTSQTNQFQNSFTELLIENMDFSQASWKSIKNGMDRLPNAVAALVGRENITMDAKVTKIAETDDGQIAVTVSDNGAPQIFDKVIMAVPPAALHMIDTPQWSPAKTHAIRALHFEPLYKIGMRFKTRFWEQVDRPANGGQSITDLPSRWFVYPSYGIGDSGPGVLLLYSWMTDAVGWLPQQPEERVRLAIRDLQKVYGDSVDIKSQFIEFFDVNWTQEDSTGDAMFFPGQFRNLFNVARTPEGNVFFAGEHLSVHHTWIVGAIDSAIHACGQLLQDTTLVPLGADQSQTAERVAYDYGSLLEKTRNAGTQEHGLA